SGSKSFPELNPDLQQYQDLSKCFPLSETWYTLYRNFESDPDLGGSDKCVRYTETGPPADGAYPLLFQFGDQAVNVTGTLGSTPGYTGKNILSIGQSGGSTTLDAYVAYLECNTCSVLRTVYINDTTCALLVPRSQLSANNTCCDFIFDLLCGTGKKYYISDESCPT
ncbi:unnamed protein product, partial [Ixodes hexagonus]